VKAIALVLAALVAATLVLFRGIEAKCARASFTE